jgi:methyl-accepting chemotaxis protein/methyl-accepting chemotaxis protein-1 (serine sensor receptor)
MVADLKSVYEDRVVPLKQISAISDAFAIKLVDTMHRTQDDAMTIEQALAAVATARTTSQTEWKAYTETYLVPEEVVLVEKAKPLLAQASLALDKAGVALRAGDKKVIDQFADHDMYPMVDPIQTVLKDLEQIQLDVAKATYEQGVEMAKHAVMMWAGLLLASVILGAGLATAIIRRIVRWMPSLVKSIALLTPLPVASCTTVRPLHWRFPAALPHRSNS